LPRGDQNREYRFSVGIVRDTDHSRIADLWVLPKYHLDLRGVDVFTPRDDHVFFPVNNAQEPVAVDRPEISESAFKNGWFYTGDIGSIDSDGFLSIVDRKKDMIITGGENVYSAEVEVVLRQHPQISDAAVIGVPDDAYGEAVFAVLVAAGQTAPNIQSVIDFARQRIGGYKIPRQMVFVDELPKSALGKVLKADLRARYQHEL
jgi:acyl-CoA synthetase (AMP-forming)/AMP-acid ligase II